MFSITFIIFFFCVIAEDFMTIAC